MSFLIDSSRNLLHIQSRRAAGSISSYSKNYKEATSAEEEPKIPAENLFKFQGPTAVEPGVPTLSECAVHLELLEVFFVLRHRVLTSKCLDKVLGIEEQPRTITQKDGTTKQVKDKDFSKRRELKWTKYLDSAVARFIAWRRNCSRIFSDKVAIDCTLPPVDVLMVWHAFLLNPRFFRRTSFDLAIYKLDFPWQRIHEAIDNNDWTFVLPKKPADHFQEVTGLSSNLFEQLSSWKTGSHSKLSDLHELNLELETSIPSRVLALSKSHFVRRHFEMFQNLNLDFARQLRDAVIRQTSFIDKMNAHLWIRSPAAEGTIRRAIGRYNKFLKLYKLYPTKMFVPTLDIDLVWHTHQCSPSGYFEATNRLGGKFINHDDSIVKDRLDTGFENTRNLYRIRFAEEYPICGCWDCEALLSELEHPTFGDDGKTDWEVIAKRVVEDVHYYRQVEISRREKKKPLPVRD